MLELVKISRTSGAKSNTKMIKSAVDGQSLVLTVGNLRKWVNLY